MNKYFGRAIQDSQIPLLLLVKIKNQKRITIKFILNEFITQIRKNHEHTFFITSRA